MKKIFYPCFLFTFLTPLTPSATYANESPPFSEAVKVGNILYLSGQIGAKKFGQPLVSGGIEAETRQTMENIKKILEKNGSSLDKVFKCTVMMTDMQEWPLMNKVYASYFQAKRYPARSALGVNGLALNARVEIECMATVTKKIAAN